MTNNTEKKLIAIMGATGAQGGATIKAFNGLNAAEKDLYELRAITRDPESDNAKAIAPLVKEVVKADGDSLKEMTKAFEGCYGAFIVTNFWQGTSAVLSNQNIVLLFQHGSLTSIFKKLDMNVKHEMDTLRNCLNAAKAAGVKHICLSSLEDCRELINKAGNKDTWKVIGDESLGMYVPHFDGKGQVSKEFADSGLPITNFLTTFYYENFIYFGMGPAKHGDGPHAITFPMGDMKKTMVSVADIGKAACAILRDPNTIGKTVGVTGDILTCKEIADTFSKVLGVPVVYNDVPTEVYASFGFPGADEMANMFRFEKEFQVEFFSNREMSSDFIEKMGGRESFEDWLTANKNAFKL
jgi:uncharacterized protein YbjT (DUF2867 family)